MAVITDHLPAPTVCCTGPDGLPTLAGHRAQLDAELSGYQRGYHQGRADVLADLWESCREAARGGARNIDIVANRAKSVGP